MGSSVAFRGLREAFVFKILFYVFVYDIGQSPEQAMAVAGCLREQAPEGLHRAFDGLEYIEQSYFIRRPREHEPASGAGRGRNNTVVDKRSHYLVQVALGYAQLPGYGFHGNRFPGMSGKVCGAV